MASDEERVRVEAATATPRLRAGASLSWDLTRACNFRCGHCSNADDRAQAGPDLDLPHAAHMLGEFAAAGGTSVHLLGGEPLLRKDLFATLEVAHRLGLATAITSNGWFHPPESATRWLLEHLNTLTISIDGDTPEVNDPIRHPHSFQRAVRSLEHYRRIADELGAERAKLNVSHVLCKANADRVDKLIALCRDLAVDSVSITYLKQYGNALKPGAPEPASAQALFDAMFSAAALATDHPPAIVLYEVPRRLQAVIRHRYGEYVGFGGGEYCDTAEDQLRVSTDGLVYPCFAGTKHHGEYGLDVAEVDIRDHNLVEILNGEYFDRFTADAHSRLANTRSDICRDCRYFLDRSCYPGCPYHSYDIKPQLCKLLVHNPSGPG